MRRLAGRYRHLEASLFGLSTSQRYGIADRSDFRFAARSLRTAPNVNERIRSDLLRRDDETSQLAHREITLTLR